MPSLSRTIRNLIKRSSSYAFRLGQRAGFDLLPRHFYSSIPDLRELDRSAAWRRPLSMAGIGGASLDSQVNFARECCPQSVAQRAKLSELVDYATRENGEIGYGPIETLFLYCFIATKKPSRIVQVGAGFSTAIILRAAKEAGVKIDICCVDPFPTDYLRRMAASGAIRLIAEPAQSVELSTFESLGDGDLLFIDSTHTVKVGSEVNRLVLEVLPRLPKGCFVHFHDITFPYDYGRLVFREPFFWSESTLVQAYLVDNARCELRVAMSMLHYLRTTDLKTLFPEYIPAGNADGLDADPPGHFPSSLYLQMTQEPIGVEA
jgi:predicted O-methyltransferase YrrM